MPDAHTEIHSRYIAVKESCRTRWGGEPTGRAIRALVLRSLQFLSAECSPVALTSRVRGKVYRGFRRNQPPQVVSRPANDAYFLSDVAVVERMWEDWPRGTVPPADLQRFFYTVALAPCLAMELFDRQNKKGPATYFECLIGYLFAKTLGTEPRKKATLPVQSRTVRLTMDFLFEANNHASMHLAVKMSTRERVVQAWAHQRLLDSAFGVGTYRGVMVLFGETKLDSRSLEVVEICVPDQWLAYQALLSRMERIYYFDPPERYCNLGGAFPGLIQLKPFGDFFNEIASVLAR